MQSTRKPHSLLYSLTPGRLWMISGLKATFLMVSIAMFSMQSYEHLLNRLLLFRLVMITAQNYLISRHPDLSLKHFNEDARGSCTQSWAGCCFKQQTSMVKFWMIGSTDHREMCFWAPDFGNGNNTMPSVELHLLWTICSSFTAGSRGGDVFMVRVQVGIKK